MTQGRLDELGVLGVGAERRAVGRRDTGEAEQRLVQVAEGDELGGAESPDRRVEGSEAVSYTL